MTKIADLLDRDLSRPIEEIVDVRNHDSLTVFTELTEYVVTDRIRAEYEGLFSAVVSAVKSPDERIGIWISGFFGSGKSSFAKNLGYVLANREVVGASATSLFVQQLRSEMVAQHVDFLNRTIPYEIFPLHFQAELPAHASAEQIAALMYNAVLRELDSTEDHLVDTPRSRRLGVREWVEKLFDLCEIRGPGKSLIFILDEIGDYVAFGGEPLRHLRAILEQFGKTSLERLQAGRIPGPAWVVFTGEEKLPEALEDLSAYHIDLSRAGISEVVATRVLGKKKDQECLVRMQFGNHGASLIQNVTLERCSRRTEFDEDQFVRFYPYLPHFIDLSNDIVAGIRLDSDAPKHLPSGSRTIVKQCFDVLASDQTRFSDKLVGFLVSIDDIYELLEASLPLGKQHDVIVISEHCDHKDYPGMTERVVKAICLMEFAETDLPRTANNIAALLIQHVTEPPPIDAVAAVLEQLSDAHFISETAGGWKLYEYNFDELHFTTAALDGLKRLVGTVNPRPPGLQNALIQFAKKSLARVLSWYTRRLHEFNGSVTRSIEVMVGTLGRLGDLPTDIVVIQKELAQLDGRCADSIESMQERIACLEEQVSALLRLSKPAHLEASAARMAAEPDRGERALEPSRTYIKNRLKNDRTAYVLGLFGTGRLYVREVIRQNIGPRARYLREGIRLHLVPTSMIYSGHATIRHISRAQNLPAITSHVLEAVRTGIADLIFTYRHPLDSLVTNWVWWRTHLRDSSCISGIAQVYQNTDDLCADLEENFLEFKAFAEGDPSFYANATRGPRFLSFSEFVEETELYLQSGITLRLRLEDFMTSPVREFSKIAEVMSVDLELSRLRIAFPRSKPYGYVAVREKVPRFAKFIDGLNTETKRRIERIGYDPI